MAARYYITSIISLFNYLLFFVLTKTQAVMRREEELMPNNLPLCLYNKHIMPERKQFGSYLVRLTKVQQRIKQPIKMQQHIKQPIKV